MLKQEIPNFARPIVDPLFYMLTFTSVLCAALISVREFQVDFDYVQYRFLLWNLFLAWLPLVFSMLALVFTRLVKGNDLFICLSFCGIAWLLLFPNAPYLTTDLIHLIFNSKYEGYDRNGLLLWYDLVTFFLFAWCGLLLCYLSMRHFHSIVSYYISSWVGWLFVLIVSFLGGFGVYLGRVVRLNSWDVLFSPFRLINGIIEGINANAAVFSFLFGTLILIVYVSLFILGRNRNESSQSRVLKEEDL